MDPNGSSSSSQGVRNYKRAPSSIKRTRTLLHFIYLFTHLSVKTACCWLDQCCRDVSLDPQLIQPVKTSEQMLLHCAKTSNGKWEGTSFTGPTARRSRSNWPHDRCYMNVSLQTDVSLIKSADWKVVNFYNLCAKRKVTPNIWRLKLSWSEYLWTKRVINNENNVYLRPLRPSFWMEYGRTDEWWAGWIWWKTCWQVDEELRE